MNKSNMNKIAESWGVKFGEKFIIRNKETMKHVVLDKEGVHIVLRNNKLSKSNKDLFADICSGAYNIQKFDWCPKKGDRYWRINDCGNNNSCLKPFEFTWENSIMDFMGKSLGIIYQTEQECQNNSNDDWFKLQAMTFGTSRLRTENKMIKLLDWDSLARMLRQCSDSHVEVGLLENWEETYGTVFDNGEIKKWGDWSREQKIGHKMVTMSSQYTPVAKFSNGEFRECYVEKPESEIDYWVNYNTLWPENAKSILYGYRK